MWPMLFLKTSPVQYSYVNDFSGVFDAFHQSFLVEFVLLYQLFYCFDIILDCDCGRSKTKRKIVSEIIRLPSDVVMDINRGPAV